MTIKQAAEKRSTFWYGIPGAMFGSDQPSYNQLCQVAVAPEFVMAATEYFRKHKRSVEVTETRVSDQYGAHLVIRYRFTFDTHNE